MTETVTPAANFETAATAPASAPAAKMKVTAVPAALREELDGMKASIAEMRGQIAAMGPVVDGLPQAVNVLRHRLDEFQSVEPRIHSVDDAFYALHFCIAYLDCAVGLNVHNPELAKEIFHCLKLLEKWSHTARRNFAIASQNVLEGIEEDATSDGEDDEEFDEEEAKEILAEIAPNAKK